MNTGGGTNVRRIGMYDDNDGFFFQHDGTVFSLVCRKGGSDTNTVSSGSFNGPYGNVLTITVDTVFTCEIYVTNKNAFFLINDRLIHTFEGVAAPLAGTLTLPLRAESINSGGNTTDNIIYVRAASLNRLGILATEGIYRNIVGATGAGGTVLKYGAGKLQRLVIGSVPANGQSIVLYDNTSAAAPIIGTITIANASDIPISIEYNCPFFTGLTIVTVGAALNITVVYE